MSDTCDILAIAPHPDDEVAETAEELLDLL